MYRGAVRPSLLRGFLLVLVSVRLKMKAPGVHSSDWKGAKAAFLRVRALHIN